MYYVDKRLCKRNPARFGMNAEQATATSPEIEAELERALKARAFDYTKSDGQSHTISLWDLTLRQKDLEMAYNPNDCVETRWAAPKESAESTNCKRSAPKSQRRKMQRYRPWFSERKRPPRGTRR